MSKATRDTLFINGETGEYPVPLSVVVQSCGNVSFAAQPLLEDLALFGFFEVQESQVPEGDVVTEGTPVLKDGVWTRTWNVRDFTEEERHTALEEAKIIQISKLQQLRTQEFESGIPYEVDGKVFHIQCRAEDRAILLMLNMEVSAAIQQGSTEPREFRTAENETIYLTPLQMHAMLTVASAKGNAAYVKSWALRDEIDAAQSLDEIPALPETLF